MVFDADSFIEKTGVSRGTMGNIRCYHDLLVKWQKKINLVSNDSLAEIWSRHFYDSFQLRALFDPARLEKRQILDIGSGAGFPGLLLSMLEMGTFHLVESNGKKCAFLNQVIRETGCDAVVHSQRVEKMRPFPVDYIISRACASVVKLLGYGQNFMGKDTVCLFLKGQRADDEIAVARLKWCFEMEKFASSSKQSGIIVKISDIRALNEAIEEK